MPLLALMASKTKHPKGLLIVSFSLNAKKKVISLAKYICVLFR